MSKFLSFDEIVDSMIVRKNGTQYVMVIHCKGINYDLLGEEEKLAVEGGFTQFLNTLRFPVQLYIQTRSLNLRDSIDQYEEKVNEIKEDIDVIKLLEAIQFFAMTPAHNDNTNRQIVQICVGICHFVDVIGEVQ